MVDTTVYVTGSFSRARPPGVALGGAGEIDAGNIFAFDITTGNPVAFNHSLDGQGMVVRWATDGQTLYVGGDFTSVDGQPRGHIAAFDTASGPSQFWLTFARATRPRATLARMSSAVAVQTKGLGSVLWAVR